MKRLILISILVMFFGQAMPSDSQSVAATVSPVASTGAASNKIGDALLAEQAADLQQMRQFATTGIQDETSAAGDIKKAMKNLADQAKNDKERLLDEGVLDGYLDSLNKIVSNGQDALNAKTSKYQGLIDAVLDNGSKKLTDLAGTDPDSIAIAGDYKTTLSKQVGDSKGQVVDARDRSLDEISSLQTALIVEIRGAHQKEASDSKDQIIEILIGSASGSGVLGSAAKALLKYIYNKYSADLAESAKYYAKKVLSEKIPSLATEPTEKEKAAIKKLGLPEEYKDLKETSGAKAVKLVIDKLSMVGKSIKESIKSKFNFTDDQVEAIMSQAQDPVQALERFESERILISKIVQDAGAAPLSDSDLALKVVQKIKGQAEYNTWKEMISGSKSNQGAGKSTPSSSSVGEPAQEPAKVARTQQSTVEQSAGLKDSGVPATGAVESGGLSTGGMGFNAPIKISGVMINPLSPLDQLRGGMSSKDIAARTAELSDSTAALDQSVSSARNTLGIDPRTGVPMTQEEINLRDQISQVEL